MKAAATYVSIFTVCVCRVAAVKADKVKEGRC